MGCLARACRIRVVCSSMHHRSTATLRNGTCQASMTCLTCFEVRHFSNKNSVGQRGSIQRLRKLECSQARLDQYRKMHAAVRAQVLIFNVNFLILTLCNIEVKVEPVALFPPQSSHRNLHAVKSAILFSATAFRQQGYTLRLDASNVKDMTTMFHEAKSFHVTVRNRHELLSVVDFFYYSCRIK